MFLICGLAISCKPGRGHKHSGNVSFTVEESDHSYRIYAGFDPDRQSRLEAVLDKYLKQDGDPSFANSQIDAEMTLAGQRSFYIKLLPGKFDLKASKYRNSAETMDRFKALSREIKKAVL